MGWKINGKGLIQKGYYSKGNRIRAAIETIISHLKDDDFRWAQDWKAAPAILLIGAVACAETFTTLLKELAE